MYIYIYIYICIMHMCTNDVGPASNNTFQTYMHDDDKA